VTPFQNDQIRKSMVQYEQFNLDKSSDRIASESAKLSVREDHDVSICDLPGDPSLLLTTNVDLGSTKIDVMKGTTHVQYLEVKFLRM
jgi:hypothetical protein